MQTTREYPERALTRLIGGADTPVGFATRLWKQLIPDDIRNRINEISAQFTGAGWKNLPQELVDEILGYLLDDLLTLKACSLTCRCLFGATRPLIHRRLVCLGSRPEGPKPKGSLLGLRKRDLGEFGWLIEADRSGVLRYTQHLTIKVKDRALTPMDTQEYLPHLRSITKLRTLTLNTFHLHPFVPVFNAHFGMFTHTLRHLDIRNACGSEQRLLYIVCQFPLLEDLAVISPAGEFIAGPNHPVPMVTRSPPLRGKLLVAQVHSKELFKGLVALPGGLNFRSLELHQCKYLEVIFAACGKTATSISYLWLRVGIDTIALDLRQCVILKRFEFSTKLSALWQIDRWLRKTLRTITSTLFNEFVIWILGVVLPWGLRYPLSDVGWGGVDALLNNLAKRNPDFRVVFRGDFDSFRYGTGSGRDTVRHLIEDHLPLISSKGLVKFEQVCHGENRFRKSSIL